VRWNLVVVADSPPSVKTAENLRTDVGLSLLFSFQRTGSLVRPSGITGRGERPKIVAGGEHRRHRVLSMKLEVGVVVGPAGRHLEDPVSGRTSESSLVARRCQGQRGNAKRLHRLNELEALGGSGGGSAETACEPVDPESGPGGLSAAGGGL